MVDRAGAEGDRARAVLAKLAVSVTRVCASAAWIAQDAGVG
jgi:hypothetical protein